MEAKSNSVPDSGGVACGEAGGACRKRPHRGETAGTEHPDPFLKRNERWNVLYEAYE